MMGDSRNRVVTSIRQKLEYLLPLSPNCCIYRVPENLRKVNEDAYRPLLVSIGPFYYNDPKLLAMQEHKLRYLQSFLQRNNAYNVGHFVEVITGWEQVTRQCYAEQVDLQSEPFIQMVLVDAVFIIELFLRDCFHEYIDENDRIFNKPWMILEVTRDIRLEENQLPFFILKGLYDFAFGSSSQNEFLPFVDLTYRFFMKKEKPFPREKTTTDIKHIVDFLRICYLPSAHGREHPGGNQTVVISFGVAEPSRRKHANGSQTFVFSPNVTKLSEAGVKFKASRSEDLLDIRFTKGVLEIPRLIVADDIESLFRNIMVFEQCHYYFDSYITDYFAFLDGLINTTEDVKMLVENGIIENRLGRNEEVVNLFNNTFKRNQLRVANFYYSGVCGDLNAYASTSSHPWKAILKNLWSKLSRVKMEDWVCPSTIMDFLWTRFIGFRGDKERKMLWKNAC